MKFFLKKYQNQILLAAITCIIQLVIIWVRMARFGDSEFGYVLGGGDANEYLKLGINLATKGAFFQFEQPEIALETYRMPLYPLFIALGYILFGGGLLSIILFQQLLAVAVVIAAYQVFLMLFKNKSTAFIGSLIVIFDLQRMTATTAISSEALFLFLFFLTVYFLMRFAEKPSYAYALSAGLALGLATMTRVFAFYLIVACVIYILFLKLSRILPLKKCVMGILIFIAAFQLTLLPWLARNFKQFGVWKLSTSAEYNLYTRHLERMYEYKLKLTEGRIDPYKIRKLIYEPLFAETDIKDDDSTLNFYLYQFKYAPYLKQKALDAIKDNKWFYLYAYIRRIPVWFLDSDLAFQATRVQIYFFPILDTLHIKSVDALWFGRFVWMGLYTIIFIGVLCSPKSYKRLFPHFMLVLLLTASIALMGALILTPRHKMPVDFFAYALTVYSLQEIIAVKFKRGVFLPRPNLP